MATAPAVLDTIRLGALVDALASGLRPPAEVWRAHGVTTKDEAARIMALPMVRQMLDEARLTWLSREALPLRVKVKAGALVEDALVFMHAGAISPLQPLSQRVAAFSALAKMAGVEQPPESRVGAGGGGGFGAGGVAVSIMMDLGGGNVVGVRVGGSDTEIPENSGDGDDDTFLLDPASYAVVDGDAA